MKLCDISPTFKKFLWQRWYQHIAGYQATDWRFMNYGFSDEESEQVPLALQPADEGNRFAIQLYHRVASAADLNGLDVLEVGCSRGGGAFGSFKFAFAAKFGSDNRSRGSGIGEFNVIKTHIR
jgi:hypothetical protein